MTGGGTGPARPTPGRPKLTFYGRAGCHLCEDALALIEQLRERIPFELEQRDIDSDEGWFKRYLERIPVVELDGHEVFELFVDQRKLEQMLASRKQAPDPQ